MDQTTAMRQSGLPIGLCFGSADAPAKISPAEMELLGESVADAMIVLMIMLRVDKRVHLPKYQAAYTWLLEVQLMMTELFIWQSMDIKPLINPTFADCRPVPCLNLLTFFRAYPEKVLDAGIDHILALSGQNTACANSDIQSLLDQLRPANTLRNNFYLLNAIKLLLPDDLMVVHGMKNFFKLVSKCIQADFPVFKQSNEVA